MTQSQKSRPLSSTYPMAPWASETSQGHSESSSQSCSVSIALVYCGKAPTEAAKALQSLRITETNSWS